MKNFQQTPRQQRKALEKSKTRVANSRKPTSIKAPLVDRLWPYQPSHQHFLFTYGWW